MSPDPARYPWYGTVSGDNIEQGDILENCPVFSPRDISLDPLVPSKFQHENRDVIVMSQSCDLVKGRADEQETEVLLCILLKPSKLQGNPLSTKDGLNDLRAGRRPAFHLLAESTIPEFEREVQIVSFRHLRSLPLRNARYHAQHKLHLRLLPPYREHLSQAFARFFMRVGLPIDMPAFR